MFALEKTVKLFIVNIETGRLVRFEKLREFKDACTASDPAQHLDLQQLADFTANPLQSFKVCLGQFCERTHLFEFITHPHKWTVDKADLNYIPGVSMRDFEVEIADVKASDIWVNKFKSLNEDFKRLAQQQIALVSKHKWTEMKKTSTWRPADWQNMELASCILPHKSHSTTCEYCCTDHVWLYVCMWAEKHQDQTTITFNVWKPAWGLTSPHINQTTTQSAKPCSTRSRINVGNVIIG